MSERPCTGETFSVEQASKHAVAFCKRRPAWIRICDIPSDSGSLYVEWPDLSARLQAQWETEANYNEWARKKSKFAVGYVTGKGEFYADDILKVPLFHNVMTVFRVGSKQANAWRAATCPK